MENKYEVGTFNSATDQTEIVETFDSWNEAWVKAIEIWQTDEYYGVVIVDNSNDIQPIQWIKTKLES